MTEMNETVNDVVEVTEEMSVDTHVESNTEDQSTPDIKSMSDEDLKNISEVNIS